MDNGFKMTMWVIVLIAEALMLAAMLLGDFGVLHTSIDPMSLNGLLYHAVAVVLIVISVVNIRRCKK